MPEASEAQHKQPSQLDIIGNRISERLDAVGVPTPEPMAVIDQHMEAIKVVYPSEYNAIVAKIRSLHDAT